MRKDHKGLWHEFMSGPSLILYNHGMWNAFCWPSAGFSCSNWRASFVIETTWCACVGVFTDEFCYGDTEPINLEQTWEHVHFFFFFFFTIFEIARYKCVLCFTIVIYPKFYKWMYLRPVAKSRFWNKLYHRCSPFHFTMRSPLFCWFVN